MRSCDGFADRGPETGLWCDYASVFHRYLRFGTMVLRKTKRK